MINTEFEYSGMAWKVVELHAQDRRWRDGDRYACERLGVPTKPEDRLILRADTIELLAEQRAAIRPEARARA